MRKREKNQRNQSDEPELVVMDQDAEELSFHGKKLKVHKDFRLVLILRDGHTKVPKFLLEKVMLIKELNFCMNWITLDSINSTFLLGGNYVNSVGDKSK